MSLIISGLFIIMPCMWFSSHSQSCCADPSAMRAFAKGKNRGLPDAFPWRHVITALAGGKAHP
ncbi:hypothetical protein ACFQ3C_09560 [Seohaeicola saemankumensis]|uniref:Uncharacterized protein n=1 Tax=Seohaeicola saemankumensis TaxID=481181 RepID=A0ABW3TDJ0_9RHOB